MSISRIRAIGRTGRVLAVVASGSRYARGRLSCSKGDREKAKQTIGRLLDLWKDADSNLLLLEQAKDEYGKPQ